jgi:hypothetical protein
MDLFTLRDRHHQQCNRLHNIVTNVKGGRKGHTSFPTSIIKEAIRLYDNSPKNEKDFARSVGLIPRTFCGWLARRRHFLGTPSFPDFGEFSAPSEGFFQRVNEENTKLQATTIGEYMEQGA